MNIKAHRSTSGQDHRQTTTAAELRKTNNREMVEIKK